MGVRSRDGRIMSKLKVTSKYYLEYLDKDGKIILNKGIIIYCKVLKLTKAYRKYIHKIGTKGIAAVNIHNASYKIIETIRN